MRAGAPHAAFLSARLWCRLGIRGNCEGPQGLTLPRSLTPGPCFPFVKRLHQWFSNCVSRHPGAKKRFQLPWTKDATEVPLGAHPRPASPFPSRPGPTYRMWLPNVGGEEEGVGGGVQESASWGPGDGNSRCLQPSFRLQPREEDLATASWDTAAWLGARSPSQTRCQHFRFPAGRGDALEPPAWGLGP